MMYYILYNNALLHIMLCTSTHKCINKYVLINVLYHIIIYYMHNTYVYNTYILCIYNKCVYYVYNTLLNFQPKVIMFPI